VKTETLTIVWDRCGADWKEDHADVCPGVLLIEKIVWKIMAPLDRIIEKQVEEDLRNGIDYA